MAGSGYIRKSNCLLDYGCGKGRVDFFLSYQTRCRSVGVEYDSRIYETVCENKRHAVSGSRTEFVMGNAENYVVPAEAVSYTHLDVYKRQVQRERFTAIRIMRRMVMRKSEQAVSGASGKILPDRTRPSDIRRNSAQMWPRQTGSPQLSQHWMIRLFLILPTSANVTREQAMLSLIHIWH